jgi:serine/threonine-protein kinase
VSQEIHLDDLVDDAHLPAPPLVAPSHPPRVLEPGSELAGYRVLRTLAFGGMAQIFLAIQASTGRLVVLKQILPHLANNHEFVQFFEHEGNLGRRLRHPNLVETIEAGRAGPGGETCFIALEYLRGKSAIDLLRAAARARIEIPLGVAVRLVADAARGLHHAHTATDDAGEPLNVVHRDVTPHNLFVCRDGVTKVLDFGIAKAASQLHHTRTGTIKGKFAYLAPEQIRGGAIDRRVDVFALGIVLYELITLRPLFRGANDAETLDRILRHEVQPPERLRRGVPPGLGAVALRALQRDPERRLPSAEALADSIEAVALAEGIEATPAAVAELVARLFPELAGEDVEAAELLRQSQVSVPSSTSETPPAGVGALPEREAALRAVASAPVGATTGSTLGMAPGSRLARSLLALLLVAAVIGLALFIAARLREMRASTSVPPPPADVVRPAEPLPTTPPPTPQPPAQLPEAAPAPEPARDVQHATPRASAPAEATLRLQGDGPLSATIDGKPARPGSDGTYRIAPGKHHVVVSGPALAAPRTLTLEAAPGDALLQRIRSGRGTLRVVATPWAEVTVDGRSAGVTPLPTSELLEGTHTIVLKNGELGATVKRKVVVQPGKETTVRVDLFAERR